MTTRETFLADIDQYLAATGASPAAFGLASVNDPNFVFDVREGRSPSLRLVEKVQRYIADHPPAPPHDVPALDCAGGAP